MPHSNASPDILGILLALLISAVSGFISIARRVLAGTQASVLWYLCEFTTAILCGYLMYHSYPVIDPILSDYVTLPIAVAIAAHSGGRISQELEEIVVEHYSNLLKRSTKK